MHLMNNSMIDKKEEGYWKQREQHVQRHERMICLENVRNELGKRMAGVTRGKLRPDHKEPWEFAKEFVLYPAGNGEPVEILKIEFTWKALHFRTLTAACEWGGLERGEIQGGLIWGKLLQ